MMSLRKLEGSLPSACEMPPFSMVAVVEGLLAMAFVVGKFRGELDKG